MFLPVFVLVVLHTSLSFSLSYNHHGHDGFRLARKRDEEDWQETYAELGKDDKSYNDQQENLINNISRYRFCVNFWGIIADDGGSLVTSNRVVWSRSSNPTFETNECYTEDGNSTFNFASEITGLLPEMIYYVRAYAVTSAGKAYVVIRYHLLQMLLTGLIAKGCQQLLIKGKATFTYFSDWQPMLAKGEL